MEKAAGEQDLETFSRDISSKFSENSNWFHFAIFRYALSFYGIF